MLPFLQSLPEVISIDISGLFTDLKALDIISLKSSHLTDFTYACLDKHFISLNDVFNLTKFIKRPETLITLKINKLSLFDVDYLETIELPESFPAVISFATFKDYCKIHGFTYIKFEMQ